MKIETPKWHINEKYLKGQCPEGCPGIDYLCSLLFIYINDLQREKKIGSGDNGYLFALKLGDCEV